MSNKTKKYPKWHTWRWKNILHLNGKWALGRGAHKGRLGAYAKALCVHLPGDSSSVMPWMDTVNSVNMMAATGSHCGWRCWCLCGCACERCCCSTCAITVATFVAIAFVARAPAAIAQYAARLLRWLVGWWVGGLVGISCCYYYYKAMFNKCFNTMQYLFFYNNFAVTLHAFIVVCLLCSLYGSKSECVCVWQYV